jgi:hypothetical protein
MKHIDVDAIRQSPRARLDFLSDFCLLSSEDWTALDESLTYLAPRLPALLDRLYDHLLNYDDTRRVFLGQRGEFDAAYIALRKEHMTEWIMRTIASSDREDAGRDEFAKYVVRVGKRHTGVAGELHRAVPPRYMVALSSFIQTVVLEALYDAVSDDIAALRRMSLAWNKIVIVQLELFLQVIAPLWPSWDEE